MFNYRSNYIHNYVKDGLIISKDSKIVYHYTSPEGFLGILKSQNVRFTDIRYMNDKSEGIYFIKFLLEYLENNKGIYPNVEEIVNDMLKENDYEDIKRLNVTNIKYRTNWYGKIKPARTFLFCTCTEPDSLNMWNYYVKNNTYQGYNIGFKVETFLKKLGDMVPENKSFSIYYGKVLYSLQEQQEEIKSLLKSLEIELSERSGRPYLSSFADMYLKRYIDLYGVFYKHPKFAGEQEYRFVIEFDNEQNDKELMFREWIDNSKNITEDFCVKNGIIAPFLNVPFSKNAIARVYLSPMTEFEIAKQSIREIIYKNNYQVFSIWESKIPIRY